MQYIKCLVPLFSSNAQIITSKWATKRSEVLCSKASPAMRGYITIRMSEVWRSVGRIRLWGDETRWHGDISVENYHAQPNDDYERKGTRKGRGAGLAVIVGVECGRIATFRNQGNFLLFWVAAAVVSVQCLEPGLFFSSLCCQLASLCRHSAMSGASQRKRPRHQCQSSKAATKEDLFPFISIVSPGPMAFSVDSIRSKSLWANRRYLLSWLEMEANSYSYSAATHRDGDENDGDV